MMGIIPVAVTRVTQLMRTVYNVMVGAPSMQYIPDSKVHGANMGPIWGRQDPGGPHVGPMNFAFWDAMKHADTET